MAQELGAPADPSARIESIDVVRGFALLGILAMNVSIFAAPFPVYSNPTLLFPYDGHNRITYWIVHVLFDLKMMSIFSMLFGAGVVMWDDKIRRKWIRPAACLKCSGALSATDDRCSTCGWRVQPPLTAGTGLWFRRMGWLFAIGFIHAYLIWEGDILVAYALTGMILVWWLRRLSPVALIAIAVPMLIPTFLLTGVTGAWAFPNEFPVAARGMGLPQDTIVGMRNGYEDFVVGVAPSPEQLTEAMEPFNGTWPELAIYRVTTSAIMQLIMYPLYIFWRVGCMMLIGAALYKLGVFTGRRSTRFYLIGAAISYALGLPLVITGIAFNEQTGFNPASFNLLGTQFNAIGSIPVAIGHVCLLNGLLKLGVLGVLGRSLQAVGRMALTNYLMHSIICSIIFYGFAFGLHGSLDRFQQQIVVVSIWVAQLVWSPIWLSSFRFGPAEWLWRSLTYWKRQPMRRA